jgi:Tat protein translocase TatB subunit
MHPPLATPARSGAPRLYQPALLVASAGSIMRPMGFSETIFLFFLALLIFGPKKLPEIARQVGKVLNELRRASNEFKSQIESEISHLEREQQQRALPASEKPKNTVEALPSTAGASSSGQAEQSAMARVPDA